LYTRVHVCVCETTGVDFICTDIHRVHDTVESGMKHRGYMNLASERVTVHDVKLLGRDFIHDARRKKETETKQ